MQVKVKVNISTCRDRDREMENHRETDKHFMLHIQITTGPVDVVSVMGAA